MRGQNEVGGIERWALHRASGYAPGQPGYISDLSADEMFPPPFPSCLAKRRGSTELDPLKVAIITGIVIAALAIAIFLFKHYGIF